MADRAACGEDAAGVRALLERVAGVVDGVRTTQQRMEERQLELEATVRSVQADVVRLTRDHARTGATVDRLLEKTRKVSRHVKDVRVRVENQNLRVKKVEATQGDLLAKNKFRVVIYQVRPGPGLCWSNRLRTRTRRNQSGKGPETPDPSAPRGSGLRFPLGSVRSVVDRVGMWTKGLSKTRTLIIILNLGD